MNHNRPYAVSCELSSDETIEGRLFRILAFWGCKHVRKWKLSALDATGPVGGSRTEKINDKSVLDVNEDDLYRLVNENGQIFELIAEGIAGDGARIRIIVRGGMSIDVLGFGNPPGVEEIGCYFENDPSKFLWGL